MPFLSQPSQFILAWDRHKNMLDYIPPWLDCISPWLGSFAPFTALFQDYPGKPVPEDFFWTFL